MKRTPWIFRAAKDGREVSISKWSKVDLRYRGVFKTLKNVPSFKHGLFDGGSGSGSGRGRSNSNLSSKSPKSKPGSSRVHFEKAVKAQGQVVYALLDEVLNMLRIRREAEDHREYFYLRYFSIRLSNFVLLMIMIDPD